MDITLDDVIQMLEDIQEDVDYETCTTLIDDHVLDSFDILAIVSATDDEFDVTIPAKDIIPDNFNSAAALHALIQRLADED
ncbi:MAG: acyl carrier protein [Coriobacteriales bacterium]|nr:acyl carrier protein [Coriobacteriales bacterium]